VEAQKATADVHIPDDEIRGAFDFAMTALVHWTKEGGEEPKVTLNGEPYLIGGRSRRNVQGDNAAELILANGRLRKSLFERRVQAGARCLLQWGRDAMLVA
jgi:hypothetical protein